MEDTQRLILVMTATIPIEGVAAFQAYETAVIPLLAKHHGVLERRLSNGDGTVEFHIISFANKEAFDGYCHEPERLKHTHLFEKSGAQTELRQMMDLI